MLTEKDIDTCRTLFGLPGERDFGFFERQLYLRINRPNWCDKSDDLFDLFENKWNLMDYGNIVWGSLVQANEQLFKKGFNDCPASVVFCPNPSLSPSFDQLNSAARSMFQLKHTTPDNDELRKIAEALTDELERTFGVSVPKQFCSEFQLYEASTFISRKHLPDKILSKGVFPLLVSHCKPIWCLPLPSRYWPQSLIEYWYDKD